MRLEILMKMKVSIFVAIFAVLGMNSFAAEKRFIMNNAGLPGYASYPTQVFHFPSYYGKLFLANTAEEMFYASYPGYASYPEYASYPAYVSYPNPRRMFEARAQLVCKFMNFSRARYASSQDASVPANLISVGYDEYGDIFASTRAFTSIEDTLPTFIDTLECVR